MAGREEGRGESPSAASETVGRYAVYGEEHWARVRAAMAAVLRGVVWAVCCMVLYSCMLIQRCMALYGAVWLYGAGGKA